jgi:peroxiredoxin
MFASLGLLFLFGMSTPAPVVDDFELRDYRGPAYKLSDFGKNRLVVVAFLGVDCPVSRKYAVRLAELATVYEPRGVAFLGVDANHQDSPSGIGRLAADSGIGFPILKDLNNAVADRLGVERTPEVLVLDAGRAVRYRGRVDDQFSPTVQRNRPPRRDLATALDELLRGDPVSVPRTEPAGCRIGRVRASEPTTTVTYCRDIAPILQRRCQTCHRPGQTAPFSLVSYDDARSWADTIREVIQENRMPPWQADPKHGKFANDPRPSDQEKRLLFEWIDGGRAEGDPKDLPPAAVFIDAWNIPKPDRVVSIPEPFAVPATGVVDYQTIEVDPGFREDKWITAAEIRPGNRAVVHHCNVYLKPPGHDDIVEFGSLGSVCLAETAVGTPPLLLPEGMAKKVPAGWHLVFVIHYTPIGKPQTDQTGIGLVFADPKKVRQEVATKILLDSHFRIPPRAARFPISQSWQTDDDLLLLAMFPHMHVRGRSFRYEAAYPDGTTEILLDVPAYDFQWQNRYVLETPKRLPAGTRLTCTAVYDNSADNPANPDPDAEVKAGPQTTDEMFNGYFEVVRADEDLTRPDLALLQAIRERFRPAVGVPLSLGLMGLLAVSFWLRKRTVK